ncbi:MAG: mechanosensitive ion channel family protein [Candidatus Methanofastidiosum sp.]|nr:mechanosensitive ion channel family protein [Methanofastidiosum sp.]
MILDNHWILEIFILAISIIFSILIINIFFYILKKVDRDEKFFNFFKLKNPLIFISFLALFITITNIFESEIIRINTVTSIIKIIVIFNFTWLSISFVNVLNDYLYQIFNLSKKDNIKERKIVTQIQYIKSVLIFLIIIISCSLILISFDSLKNIGVGLITSVGVLGIVIGFAAQKSFSNLLAGFQIAFTQPIRIDDVVVVEKEWGRVEEITLTYVVVCIWDQRRLILPISYFIDTPFQNWTRSSADILGTVFFYVDYKIPILEIKQEFRKILESSELWDEKVGILQVTDTTEKTMELRGIVSAKDSPQLWDLRCYVREKMIEYIQKRYPDNLPKTRLEFSNKLN